MSGIDTYDGTVSGSDGAVYTVHVDKKHPRKSTCNCLFAAGRRVICKHMVAIYFTAEPKALEDFQHQVEIWEEEEIQREQDHYAELRRYVYSLSKQRLQEELLAALVELEEKDRYWR